MPRRCCRKRCPRRYPHVYAPIPRPCVDSLQVPIDFFLSQGVFYSPPCYHAPVPIQEVICGCPRIPSDSSNNRNCMAANSNRNPCSGSCKPSDRNETPRGTNDNIQGPDEVPHMPSMNHCVERPPQYHNGQFPYPSNNNRPRHAGANDRHPFAYEQTPETDFPKGRRNEQGPPPQYLDTIDPLPPNYAYPSVAGAACCQNSPNYTEIRKVSNSERPPSPQNYSRSPSPYDRFPEQGGLDQSQEPIRYQEDPEPIRRPSFGHNQNPRSLYNTPTDNLDYYSTSPANPPTQVSSRFDSGPSPCCANALGQKKKEGPPLPHKGISGAHRPGYLVEDESMDDDFLENNPSRCMTAKGSGCVHGITSIMPNYSSHILPEKKPSVKGVTCTCKDAMGKTVKPLRKNNCRKEAGTEVCDSTTCLANKNRYCPCTYPPAFKNYSCTGNITGTCKCTQGFP